MSLYSASVGTGEIGFCTFPISVVDPARYLAIDRPAYHLTGRIAPEAKLNLAQIHKKKAEARSLLGHIINQDGLMLSDGSEAYLSAFLAAGMSVRDPFKDKAVSEWRENWEKSLTPDERRLWDVMHEARNDEAHIARKWRPSRSRRSRRGAKAGLKLCVGQQEIKVGVGSSYSDKSGRVEGYGSPAVLLALGYNTTTVIYKQTYSFNIDGEQRKATEVCAAYLELLERMVAQFEADHP